MKLTFYFSSVLTQSLSENSMPRFYLLTERSNRWYPINDVRKITKSGSTYPYASPYEINSISSIILDYLLLLILNLVSEYHIYYFHHIKWSIFGSYNFWNLSDPSLSILFWSFWFFPISNCTFFVARTWESMIWTHRFTLKGFQIDDTVINHNLWHKVFFFVNPPKWWLTSIIAPSWKGPPSHSF